MKCDHMWSLGRYSKWQVKMAMCLLIRSPEIRCEQDYKRHWVEKSFQSQHHRQRTPSWDTHRLREKINRREEQWVDHPRLWSLLVQHVSAWRCFRFWYICLCFKTIYYTWERCALWLHQSTEHHTTRRPLRDMTQKTEKSIFSIHHKHPRRILLAYVYFSFGWGSGVASTSCKCATFP